MEAPIFEFPNIFDGTIFKDSRAAWMRCNAPQFAEFEGNFTVDLSNNAGKELKSRNLDSFKEDFAMWVE